MGLLATVSPPWVTIHAERWRDDNSRLLDYWRAERPDSIIIPPKHRGHFLIPKPSYRVGSGETSWGLPGGRLPGQL
jgi:hypothetical protein